MIEKNGNNMKTINTYINEKLHLTAKHQYTCHPKDKWELREIILHRIKDEGNDCDLNDIDVSKITDMGCLFDVDFGDFKGFNGDISMWDVSNVTDMACMFAGCANFNGNISRWDMSNVVYIDAMFHKCKKFKQDLNSWDLSNIETMYNAFNDCPTTPDWYDRKKWE